MEARSPPDPAPQVAPHAAPQVTPRTVGSRRAAPGSRSGRRPPAIIRRAGLRSLAVPPIHAASAWRQGLAVDRITVGAGAASGAVAAGGDARAVGPRAPESAAVGVGGRGRWEEWRHQAVTLGGGVLATLLVAAAIAGVVAAVERVSRRRCVWGRILVADAVVLTVFNFLPVPPLDGGRAVLGAVAAWRDSPLAGDALFWLHVGGLALAVAPMTLWTRWTARIDAVAMWWGAPRPTR